MNQPRPLARRGRLRRHHQPGCRRRSTSTSNALHRPTRQALLATLVIFRLLPNGFANRDMREHLAPLLGLPPTSLTQGRMSYDLRRLRLHGLIQRIPGGAGLFHERARIVALVTDLGKLATGHVGDLSELAADAGDGQHRGILQPAPKLRAIRPPG